MANVDTTKPVTVQIMNSTTVVATYTFSPVDCNGNTMNYLKYINRWGVWDYIYFQGRTDSNLTTSYETYKYNQGGINYSTLTGLYHKFITDGKIKISLNTGWMDEVYNPQIEDLLLSEIVLLNGNDPVIVTDKEMKFKTARFDRMINYIIVVERAYDEINNVI